MNAGSLRIGDRFLLEAQHLPNLFDILQRNGYLIIAPTLVDGAIAYGPLEKPSDLPQGWMDEQTPGSYRLVPTGTQEYFRYVVGPHSWKKFLYPAAIRLWTAKRNGNGFQVHPEDNTAQKYAFLGVRSCELHAMAAHDKIFTQGDFTDAGYQSRRNQVFIVAVNCTRAGGTCFCASMSTGPKAEDNFDLALTEIANQSHHHFVVEVGTERAAELLPYLPHTPASVEECRSADEAVQATSAQMGRQLDVTDIKSLLYRNDEHARWDEVARRCLTCGNCTMVCPTCFCTTVEDVTDLAGTTAERWRKWDSCFTTDFSYIHGGSVRASVKSRYRQWLTHKLATWHDQFGSSGCVGCGRCITWCPVGIDLTEEVRALRESESNDVIMPPARS